MEEQARRARWPLWSAYAAMAWCAGYGSLALAWTLGAAGFPFGREGDPNGLDMGSVFFAASPHIFAPLLLGVCVAGIVVAAAIVRGPNHPRMLVAAWTLAIFMLFVVPDIRLLQNTAYALMFVFAMMDWPTVNQFLIAGGGLLFGATAAGYRRRLEPGPTAHAGLRRWAPLAAWTAFIAPMPYGITRLLWAVGIPVGVSSEVVLSPAQRIGEAVLGLLPIAGGVLALGLIQRWGEVWPRGSPVLSGRRVPIGVAAIPATLAAVVITTGGLSFARIVFMGELGLRQSDGSPTVTGWGASMPGFLWPVWGVALGVAVAAYLQRRRADSASDHAGQGVKDATIG